MAYFSKFYNGLRPIIFFCNHQERSLALGTIGMPSGLFCIVCWQEILSPSHYPLERAQRIWNSHSLWNAQSANGTAAGFGTPEGLMERAKRHTLTLKCVNFVNFVNFL